MVEFPCIRCLISSGQIVTMELTEKQQIPGIAKGRAECPITVEHTGKSRETRNASVRGKELCRPVKLLSESSLSLISLLRKNKSPHLDLFQKDLYYMFIIVLLQNCHLRIFKLLKNCFQTNYYIMLR